MRGFPTSDTAGYTTDTGAAGEASEAQLQDLSIARMMHRILGSSEANEPELGQGALFLADIEQVMDMVSKPLMHRTNTVYVLAHPTYKRTYWMRSSCYAAVQQQPV